MATQIRRCSDPWHPLGRLLLTALLVSVAVADARAGQSEDRLDERQVKAAFLYNFVKFIQWPTPESESLLVGIVGRDPFIGVLEEIVRGKNVNGREIVVRELQDEDDLRAFHVVFIGASEARRTADVLKRVGAASVLTVGETPNFLREGGIVQFYVRDNRVRFDINSAGANQAGLRISSQLLSLARQ